MDKDTTTVLLLLLLQYGETIFSHFPEERNYVDKKGIESRGIFFSA